MGQLKTLLVQHYKPKALVIVERFTFHKRDQRTGESINDFLIELRKLAWSCNFGTFLEQALRDHFVCGLTNPQIQRCLLSEKDLTLEKAVTLATAMEMAVLEPQEKPKPQPILTEDDIQYVSQQKQGITKCNCCGKQGHSTQWCYFHNYQSHKCGRLGHLQRMCTSKVETQSQKPDKTQEKNTHNSYEQHH